jgi:hypothetical protein
MDYAFQNLPLTYIFQVVDLRPMNSKPATQTFEIKVKRQPTSGIGFVAMGWLSRIRK